MGELLLSFWKDKFTWEYLVRSDGGFPGEMSLCLMKVWKSQGLF